MPLLLCLQELQGKVMEGPEKCLCIIFRLTRRSLISWGTCVLWHPIARAISSCLLPDTLCLRALNNAFKDGTVRDLNDAV